MKNLKKRRRKLHRHIMMTSIALLVLGMVTALAHYLGLPPEWNIAPSVVAGFGGNLWANLVNLARDADLM